MMAATETALTKENEDTFWMDLSQFPWRTFEFFCNYSFWMSRKHFILTDNLTFHSISSEVIQVIFQMFISSSSTIQTVGNIVNFSFD